METYSSLKAAAERLARDEWIDLVGRSLSEPLSLSNFALPSGPSADLQVAYVGSSGRDALRAAGPFYRYVLNANEEYRGGPIDSLLDFGCGWGRFTRLFLRDVPEEGLYGVDPDPRAIRASRCHVPYGCFVNSSTRPPLPFRDQFFDVVIAYSVFSHLLEVHAATWISEISRVLRPGGLLIATTHPIWLLDRVKRLQNGTEPCETHWHRLLARSWPDVHAARAQFERGEFVPADIGEHAYSESYSDVLVPRRYVWDVWGRIMEPLDYVSDPERIEQAAFVLRRRR